MNKVTMKSKWTNPVCLFVFIYLYLLMRPLINFFSLFSDDDEGGAICQSRE